MTVFLQATGYRYRGAEVTKTVLLLAVGPTGAEVTMTVLLRA